MQVPIVHPHLADPDEIIIYPDSNGEPMADTDAQYQAIVDTRFGLEQYYRDESHIYIGADLLVYYEKGDPTKSVAPDVFVSFGVPKGMRRKYLIWQEGKAPDVAFEFASQRTWRADLGWKLGLYLGLQVREYFLFDPSGDYFRPMLQGYRLAENAYQQLPPLDAARGIRGLASDMLGVELWAQQRNDPATPYVLRLYNPVTKEWLPTPADEAEARRKAEARAIEAEARAVEAEARLRELEAELRRLRGEPEPPA